MQAPWAKPTEPADGDPLQLSLRLTARSPVLGLPLGEIALEKQTGATLLGVTRDDQPVPPSAELTLMAEDLLALRGSTAALEAARRLLGN